MRNLLVALIILVASCQERVDTADPIVEINQIMQAQQDAWNSGDLESYMQGYWQNDSVAFVGRSGLTYGWEKVLNNYKKGYPDRAAMGTLQFNNLDQRVLGPDHVWVVGKWTLFRQADTLGGHYTLVWQKVNGKWVIISDHSS